MVNPSSTVPFRAPEANLETTTSWVPLATLHPSERGCGTTLLYYTALTAFVAWDPLMDLEADKNDRRCLPRAHTTWRWQAMLGPNPNTIISISFATDVAKPTGSGSGACGHQAYSVATSSVRGDGSTFLACCPTGYTFSKVADAHERRDYEQCTSSLTSGQVIHYSSPGISSYTGTSGTVTSATVAFGVPINGWMFGSQAAATGQCVNVTTTDSSPAAAKILLGVGSTMLILSLAIALAAFLLFRKARREKAVAVVGDAGSRGTDAGQVQHAYDPSQVPWASPPPWEVRPYGYAQPPPQELAGAPSSQELAGASASQPPSSPR